MSLLPTSWACKFDVCFLVIMQNHKDHMIEITYNIVHVYM